MEENKLTFISDVIDTSKFKKDAFNLIASGCGTGKTYFIANKLLEVFPDVQYCDVLFLTSRSMIAEQQAKSDHVSKFNGKNISFVRYWNGEVEKNDVLKEKGLQVMTYDKVITIIKDMNHPEFKTLSRIKIVIVDECHALFSDGFIKDIASLKVWIKDRIDDGTKIFIGLTATPDIVDFYHILWGVNLNRINDKILVNYRAKQLHCINFRTIPYLFATNKLQGKTMIMCCTINDCIELQSKLHNAAVLVSASSKYSCKEMIELRQYIVDEENLPEYFNYHITKSGKPQIIEKRKLEILITTSTAREGINLREKSGVRNVITCFTDELHISQFAGRCRYDIDNLIVVDTYIRSDNYDKDSYLANSRKEFKDFIANKENAAWFNSIAHLVEHDIYNVKRFFLGTEEGKFIDYINTRWLINTAMSEKEVDKCKIYKEEDKEEIVQKSIESRLFPLCKSKIKFNRVMTTLKECFGYEIETGRQVFNKQQCTYKLIVSFDEDKITYKPAYKTLED